MKRVCLLVALMLPACSGRSDRVPVHPVEGRVLVNGQPVAGVQVTFHPDEASLGLRPHGQTDDNGYFRLSTWKNGDGGPAGEYAVTLVWLAPGQKTADGEELDVGQDRLGYRFYNPQKPYRKITIEAGSNTLPDFHVSTVGR